MSLQGVRLYDSDGDPFTNSNPLPIQATISTSNLNIATVTAGKVPVNTITASNQSILSVGAAISNNLPVAVNTMVASNLTIASVGAAITNDLPIEISSITSTNPFQVSATNATNTSSNPIFVQVSTNTAQAHSNTVNIATSTATKLGIGTFTANKFAVQTITASNLSILSVGAAITNDLPIEISSITADNVLQISATQNTNTSTNPLYTGVGASGVGGATITVYSASATSVTIPALANLVTRTFQSHIDNLVPVLISVTNGLSPTETAANIVLESGGSMEDNNPGIQYVQGATGTAVTVKVYETVAA